MKFLLLFGKRGGGRAGRNRNTLPFWETLCQPMTKNSRYKLDHSSK